MLRQIVAMSSTADTDAAGNSKVPSSGRGFSTVFITVPLLSSETCTIGSSAICQTFPFFTDMPSIEGLVTAADVGGGGDRQMQLVHNRQARFDELTVADVMTELSTLEAVDYDGLKAARVRNVVTTLKRSGRDHLLVVERARADSPRRVRGLISRAQVERQLEALIDLTPIATSFSEIGRALG